MIAPPWPALGSSGRWCHHDDDYDNHDDNHDDHDDARCCYDARGRCGAPASGVPNARIRSVGRRRPRGAAGAGGGGLRELVRSGDGAGYLSPRRDW
eukprot:scaffold497_cov368-Prasinococcus_capsulatus_cf.AAC.1